MTIYDAYPGKAELYKNGSLIAVFDGGASVSSDEDCLLISEEGVEGWYSTPTLKTALTERGQGDGAHDVPDSDVLYSSRVVTVHFVANARDRQGLLNVLRPVELAAHNVVRLRVVDGASDTFVDGMMELSVNPEYAGDGWLQDCSLTLTCPRPERLSWNARQWQVYPLYSSEATGGLQYGDADGGLTYALSYGDVATDSRNVCTLVNEGSSRAYPVFTLNGVLNEGAMLSFSDGRVLRYGREVYAPVVLDSRLGTATVSGSDVSRYISSRGFPVVEPGGSLRCVFTGAGSGWCGIELRDTWM